MVSPDGTKTRHDRPAQGRTLAFVVAAMAIVAGFVTLGSLSPTDRGAVEATTTTTTTLPDMGPPIDPENFSVAQIATAEPLDWDRAVSSAVGHPLNLTQRDGVFYLFASDHPPWSAEAGGLSTWASTDGVDWEPIGEEVIGREFVVSIVTATPDGFVAAGARPGGSDLIVWWSDDAVEWRSRRIPTGADSDYLMPGPTAMAVVGERVVVAADHRLDRDALLTDRLAAAGIEVDMSHMSWDTRYGGEDGIQLTLLGPLGIPALTTPLETLELTEQEHEWLMRGQTREAGSPVWVVDGSGSWEAGTIPLNHVMGIVSGPDGTLIANGLGGAGLTAALLSKDGLIWREAEEDTAIRSAIIPWEDRLVSLGGGSDPSVKISTDGLTWEKTGLMDLFPQVVRWHPIAIGAGAEGLAMTIEGQASTSLSRRGPSSTTLTDGDAKLTLAFRRGGLILETDGEIHTWDLPGPGGWEKTEGIEAEVADSVVRFLEPVSGAPLAEFGFEELHRAETQSWTFRLSDIVAHHALVFSRHGQDWELWDTSDLVHGESRVRLLGVGLGRLVAVLEKPSSIPGPGRASGFEIWSAPLPRAIAIP